MMSLNKSEILDWSWEKFDFHVILTSSNLDEKEQIGILFLKNDFVLFDKKTLYQWGSKGLMGHKHGLLIGVTRYKIIWKTNN